MSTKLTTLANVDRKRRLVCHTDRSLLHDAVARVHLRQLILVDSRLTTLTSATEIA